MSANLLSQVSALTEGETSGEKVTCRLCRRQLAKYTCPRCNVPYCSLSCYRSQAHMQCSEGFYKTEVEDDINSGPSPNQKEREKMLQLLKNFEDESLKQVDLQEGREGQDIAERLGNLDLESTSPEYLWAVLTPAERTKFTKMYDDPSSELAQQLLSNELLNNDILEPWWQRPNTIESVEDVEYAHNQLTGHKYGHKPSLVAIPEKMLKPLPARRSLMYNTCSICISYAYITRRLGTSPLCNLKPDNADYYEARRLVTKLVPFLTDRKSTAIHPNLSTVTVDFWSKFDLGTMTDDLFIILLRDLMRLLKRLLITQEGSTSGELQHPTNTISNGHPHNMTLLVLSDLYHMFSSSRGHTPKNEVRVEDNHTCHKILFYAAYIANIPHVVLDTVVHEVAQQEKAYCSGINFAANEATYGPSVKRIQSTPSDWQGTQ